MHPSPSPSLLCASPASHPGVDPHTRLSRQRIPSPLSRPIGSTCAALLPSFCCARSLLVIPPCDTCCGAPPLLPAFTSSPAGNPLPPRFIFCAAPPATTSCLRTQPPPQSDFLCYCSIHICFHRPISPLRLSSLRSSSTVCSSLPALRPHRPHKHRESQPSKAPQP